MRAFAYTAFTAGGRRKSGTVIAESESHAAQLLKQRGLFVSELSGRASAGGIAGRGWRRNRLNADLQAVFTRQMAVLLAAGLTSEFALEAIRTGGAGAAMEGLAAQTRAALLDGQSLSDALETSSAGFPPYYTASIRAGETSGDVAEVFAKLAEYLESLGADRAQISTALIYPMFVAAVSLLVCGILMTTVAPEIVLMFQGSGREMPPLTLVMLAVSGWITEYWPWLLGGLVATVVFYLMAMRHAKLRDLRDTVLLRLPFVGSLIRQSAAVQYLRTLALVLTSRHAVLNAVDSAANVLTVTRFRREAEAVSEAVRAGARLSEAMAAISIIPPVVLQLMTVGEQSASLARMTERSAVLTENNLRNERKRIAALLEPMLMMVVGAGVLVIVLSVLLPIFDLQNVVAQ